METGKHLIPDYRLWLVNELANRTRKNPAYSLRAFSKALGISPTSLSQIISGKRPLARKTALKIVERCGMNPEESRVFLISALGRDWNAIALATGFENGKDFVEVDIEHFRAISDWKHYAVLSLGEVEGNRHDPSWIANKLNISIKAARETYDRLIKLGMIKRRGQGYYQCSGPLKFSTKAMEGALQKYHKENLEKASEMLEQGKSVLELYSAITMAVDEAKLPEARELIKQFRRRLCALLESGPKKRVYTLSIQLFPLSEI